MDILKTMLGLHVVVELENEEQLKGTLKQVDAKGILLKENEGVVTYVNHHKYVQIFAVKSDQASNGILSAFRKELIHNTIFD